MKYICASQVKVCKNVLSNQLFRKYVFQLNEIKNKVKKSN